MTNHTSNEPAQIIAAYFNPTIYPNPSTAAPTFTLNNTFALFATVSPKGNTRDVKTSDHAPNVAITKS